MLRVLDIGNSGCVEVRVGPNGMNVQFNNERIFPVPPEKCIRWDVGGLPLSFLEAAQEILEGRKKIFQQQSRGIIGEFDCEEGLFSLIVRLPQEGKNFKIGLREAEIRDLVRTLRMYWVDF